MKIFTKSTVWANWLRTPLTLLGMLVVFCAYSQNPFITTWKTDNPGTSNSTSITIPTTGGGYNYDVDWDNDGTYDELGIMGDVTHDFGTAGIKTIRIRGGFPRIYFNGGGDREKLLDISQWGNIAWTSMEAAFSGCSNLNISATDVPNLSGVTNMASMFFGCSNLNGPANIGTWNTQTVTNMRSMFFGADSFNKLIGTWNTAAVTDMTTMFFGDESFNQNLGNWVLNASVVMSNMLTSTGMDCANYSATLIGWSNNPLTPSGRTLGASGIKYETAAVAARNNLTMTKGWTITDAGLVSNTFYADTDGDGYGNAAVSGSFNTCAPPSGYAANTTDCNDNCAACYPAAPEICDGKDNDCNGTIDDVAACGSAGTRTWTGLISTDWHTPCNWNPGCVPTADDNVIIPNVTNDPGISAAAVAKNVVVNTGGVLTIAATGSLAIEGAAMSNAISNKGTVHNYGTIAIGAVLTAGFNGIRNEGAFTNHSGGQLQVDRAIDAGIANFSAGTFTNSAIITIGGIASPGNSGIVNGGIFNNNSGAQIQINRSTSTGLFNGGTFNNDGSLTLGANFSVGTIGIFSNGTINNNPDGLIKIDRTVTSGIRNNPGGSFQNKGALNIGAIAAGAYGLYNNAAFSNHASGQVLIERATSIGILNEGSGVTLDNYGTLTVAANNQGGIQNISSATMHNRPCAQMFLYGRRLNNAATWTNSGFFRVDFAANAHLNTGTFTNNGIIEYPQGNPIPNVVNNEIMVTETVANTCDAISPVFGLGSPLDFTVVGIFTDAAATMSAGTYTTASNTFTPTSVLAEGSYTYYVKIEDNNGGCTRIATWKLITEDCCDAPEAICKSATIALVGNSASLSTADVNNGSTYECGLQSITVSPNSFDCSHIGTPQTVTLTVTDVNNASSACQTTVTVVDNTKPTITCPSNTTLALGPNCSANLPAYALVSKSDNCTASGSITESQSPVSGTAVSGHNTAQTVTLTANDGNGNTETCQFTVTLKDVSKPTITCPANTTLALGPNCSANLPAYALVSKSDNCTASGSIMESQSPASGTTVSGHNTAQTVMLTANDGNGNTETCQFTVTLKDVTPPSITCPPNRTVNADAGLCSSVQTYTVTASDNCSYTLTRTNGLASGTAFPLGYNVVNWQVTDTGGSTTICSFSITVVDNQTPTIICPGNSTATATTGQCAAVVNYTVNGSDNCSGWSLSRTSGLQSGAQFPVGINTVIWKNTDSGGNFTTCSFTVTVTDGQLPGIICPANITANAATGSCSVTVNYTTPIVSDNCSGVTASHVSGGLSGASFAKGVNAVEWKATDAANNIKTCSFSITVNDTQAPTITCPANITANTAAGTCAATVTFGSATATDNCTPPPSVTQTGGAASGSSFPRGLHNITFKATDGVGLTKNCTFRITVVDNILPTVTCPAPIVKNTDANLCTSVTSYAVTGTDNCGSVSVTRVSGLNSGSAFPKGVNTVVWRATDIAGNVKLCTFTVTVNDAQLPTLICPQHISTNTTTSQCNRVVNYLNPTYSDNCEGGSISLFSGLASGSVFPTGVSTVIWRAFDNTANSTTCSFTITVTDNELPAITCPPSTTVSGSGSPCGFPANQLNVATASDNCAVTSLTSNAPTTLPAGSTSVTWTALDAANNQNSCVYTVTVNCGAGAEERDEVGSMKYEVGNIRDEVGGDVRASSLIPDRSVRTGTHPSSLILSPNPASDMVVITLSNQQINPDHSSGQAPDHSSGQAPDHLLRQASNQQLLLLIHDALGREVWRSVLNLDVAQVTIDLTDQRFEGGVYQVSLRTNKTVTTKSLVITRK